MTLQQARKQLEEELRRMRRLDFRVLFEGTNPGEWHLLKALKTCKKQGENDKVKVSDLVRQGTMPAPGVSRALGQAEKKGLILRRVDEADRRNTLVEFTPKGEDLVEGIQTTMDDFFDIVFSQLSSDEMMQMKKAVSHLTDVLEAELQRKRQEKSNETNI